MDTAISLNQVFVPSDDIVAREIEGEIVIVPLTSNLGDTDDCLFTLNEPGRAIWRLLDGQRSLRAVIEQLAEDFEAPEGEIEGDVVGLLGELVSRGMVVAKA